MAERNGVFISVDMEGMAGIVHLHQVMRGMPEYERSCRLMTAETNAAIAGARRAGATRIVVNDSHGDMRNFLLDELDDGVEVISGGDKPFSMGAGLDPTFEVAFFVGYHASVGSELAVMDHTYGGRTIYAMRINGRPQSETTLNAALAGSYGVRTALITGDRTTVEEATAALPGIVGGRSKKRSDGRRPVHSIRWRPAGGSRRAPLPPTRSDKPGRSTSPARRSRSRSTG
jgi:D-amino peptidase